MLKTHIFTLALFISTKVEIVVVQQSTFNIILWSFIAVEFCCYCSYVLITLHLFLFHGFTFLLCKALWATLLVLNVPSIVKCIKTKYNLKKCNYISINIISVSIYKWELNLIESEQNVFELNFSDELLRSLRFLWLWRQVLYILSVLEVPTVLCGPKLVCLRLWGCLCWTTFKT